MSGAYLFLKRYLPAWIGDTNGRQIAASLAHSEPEVQLSPARQ